MPFDGIVTRAVTEELAAKLERGKINKIYQPSETEIVMTVRSQSINHSLLFSVHPTYARFHITNDSYTNPKEPPMFCMVLRKHLAGSVIERIEQKGMERIVTFTIRTRNEIGDISYKQLIMELMGKHSNLILVDQEKGHIIDSLKHVSLSQNRHRTILPGQTYQLPPDQHKFSILDTDSASIVRKLDFNAGKMDKQLLGLLEGFSPFVTKKMIESVNLGSNQDYENMLSHVQKQLQGNNYQPAIYQEPKEDFHVLAFPDEKADTVFEEVNTMLDAFYSGKAERDRVKQQAKDLYRFIKNEQDKNVRKLKKHRQTVEKSERADHYQKMGELLTAHMHLVKPNQKEISVVDYYDPDQQEITIPLNPNKSPSTNAQNYFKTYQKLKNSRKIMETEIKRTNEEIAYFDQLLQQLDVASTDDIEEIREELREEGYLRKQRSSKKAKKPQKPAPETYQSSDGITILVGKNNKQNEYATMRLAHRDDVWLHTKDIPGSHVIIRDKEPSEKTLEEAAILAAYFSKSQQSSSVPVDYTLIRHVKKPNGSKPGYVTYDNQKTLFVTPAKDIVDQLRVK
ncbi:NFACT RNA binding domain-containing protein [Oceanobacillus sp. FSL K6-3682]|uniref:Rqc2 family fibronectin-binding protein n=1 Tax=Oceanobacillus sp. FSL K6-3682 TaxID=2921503 RepID=UPI0030D8DC17